MLQLRWRQWNKSVSPREDARAAEVVYCRAMGAEAMGAGHAKRALLDVWPRAHDAFGNVLRVTDSLANTLRSNTYNLRGMRTAQSDMDAGGWSYTPKRSVRSFRRPMCQRRLKTDPLSENTPK